MSFRDLLETAQAVSLSDRLAPDESAIWHKYCRTYSKTFSEPLSQVLNMDPLTVFKAVFSDQLDGWEFEENMDSLWEMIGSLKDRDYDAKKEKAIRDELHQIEERERQRIENNEPIHPSLGKNKQVITKDQPKSKELPKSGGLNMSAINRLNNQDREG